MLAVSLVFVGITLILNGLILWFGKDKVHLIVVNLFTGGIIIFFNLFSIVAGDQTQLVSYMGGLLFGLTNLIIAFDNMFQGEIRWSGYFCLLTTICAISISAYFFATAKMLLGAMWSVWALIWLFSFIGFTLTEKFLPVTYFMYILQGVVSTGGFGLLLLFKIIAI